MTDPRKAQARAWQLLQEHGIAQAPVDVQALAEQSGVRVVFHDLKDEISGMLVQTEDEAVIGINAKHHKNRQRFTLAHELAHYHLHADRPTVYVDGLMVHFRGHAAVRPEPIEVEANAFAAALLMPEPILRHDLRHRTIDALDESAVRRLAQQYQVSVQALTLRLMQLGLLGGLPPYLGGPPPHTVVPG